MASIRRATGVSSRLKKPATSPSVTPISDDTITTAKPTSRDTRPAKMARLSTSRPNSSVPNQWAALGGFSRLAIDSLTGE